MKYSYIVGQKFGVYIVGCHISDKTILLGRQISVSAATVSLAKRIFICLFIHLFNGSFGSHLLFGSEMMKFHFLRSLAQHVFCIYQPNFPIRHNIK